MGARRLLVYLALCGALAGALMIAGGYNISARDGHWPGVGPLLHFTMENSVALRAPAVPERLDLQDPALIRRGASHYHYTCRTCHSAPGHEVGPMYRAMRPAPPHVEDAVAGWSSGELFRIVKHGVKMTGMPAWPSTRDDEVWSVVAFLLLADELDVAAYDHWVHVTGASRASDERVRVCASCHGAQGEQTGSDAFPRLASLDPAYLAASLRAYRDGRRESGIMAPMAAELSATEIERLAVHFGNESSSTPPTDLAEAATLGGSLAREGLRDPRIPPCMACHTPEHYDAHPLYPSLGGQPADYLATQLELFREGKRGGTAFANVMTHAAKNLTDEHIAAVSAFYASHRRE